MDNNSVDPTLSTPPTLAPEPGTPHSFTPSPKPKSKSRRRWLVPVVVIAIIAVAAGGGFAYWQHTQNKPVAKPSAVATHQAQSQVDSAANQKVTTKSYSSTNFNVEINYPEAWSVTADVPSGLTITSPVTQLTDATGAAVNGKIMMSMVPKGQLPSTFGSAATAVLSSAKVNYTQPTGTQRSSTYLSFVQYAATTAKGGLDAIYVTGNNGYQKDQNIPSTDIANVDPLITVSFQKCADTACSSNLTALTIASSEWSSSSFAAPIKTLLTSLAFD